MYITYINLSNEFFPLWNFRNSKNQQKSITYKNSINQKEDFEDWRKQLKTENKMCVKDENEISTQKTTTTTTTEKKEQDWSL